MSKLDNIKQSGFKAPKGYFTNLEDRIIDEIKLDNALKKGNESSFMMPDGYLDGLEDVIMSKLPKAYLLTWRICLEILLANNQMHRVLLSETLHLFLESLFPLD